MDGASYPITPLTIGPDGNLYGMAFAGGVSGTFNLQSGSVYRVTPTGEETVLYTFGAIDRDGDTLTVLDVLARQVGVRAMFSDWPATTTFYANCMGMK